LVGYYFLPIFWVLGGTYTNHETALGITKERKQRKILQPDIVMKQKINRIYDNLILVIKTKSNNFFSSNNLIPSFTACGKITFNAFTYQWLQIIDFVGPVFAC